MIGSACCVARAAGPRVSWLSLFLSHSARDETSGCVRAQRGSVALRQIAAACRTRRRLALRRRPCSIACVRVQSLLWRARIKSQFANPRALAALLLRPAMAAAQAAPPPALDVALGGEDAASSAVPRLAERLTATWAALRAALAAQPPQAALAAQQLTFLARQRLLAPPPDDEAAALLVRALTELGSAPAAADAALLLLARWARGAADARATALLREALPAALACSGAAPAPRALFLAAAAAAPACPPDGHEPAWRAAIDTLEQRCADIRRVLPCAWQHATSQRLTTHARCAALAPQRGRSPRGRPGGVRLPDRLRARTVGGAARSAGVSVACSIRKLCRRSPLAAVLRSLGSTLRRAAAARRAGARRRGGGRSARGNAG
jgi:hypothetical protein